MTQLASPVQLVGAAVTPDNLHVVVTSTSNALGVIDISNPLIDLTIPVGGATSAISIR